MTCNDIHRYNPQFLVLPDFQGGRGRHKCAGCAYEAGYKLGLERSEQFKLALDSLPESQAGHIRHKCPHAAFAAGYAKGVCESNH